VDDHVRHLLRDCRRCRDDSGRCTIDDGFEALLRDQVLPAQAVIFGTPLYWYGVSAQLKAFLDRIFCFIAASEPEADLFVEGLMGKRFALVIASEESYPGAPLGVIHEIQEYARYTHSAFVGVVQGIGNKRRDVLLDPGDPIGRARDLGRRLADLRSTDYRLDTDRANTTWPQPDGL
jgi:multimeric flavodoxin WrbA